MNDKTPDELLARAKERGAIFGGHANGIPSYLVFTPDEFQAFTHLTAQPVQQATPLGYINRKDIERLSNYKATIWPGENEIDAVPVYLEPAAQPVQPVQPAKQQSQAVMPDFQQYVPEYLGLIPFMKPHDRTGGWVNLNDVQAAWPQQSQDALDAARYRELISHYVEVYEMGIKGQRGNRLFKSISNGALSEDIDAAIAARGATK